MFLLSGLVTGNSDLPTAIYLSRNCLSGKQKVTGVSGFQVFPWTMQKESERSASSAEVVPSELLGILQFAWFDATFKSVPIHFRTFSEQEKGLQRSLLKFNLLV